MEPNTPDSLDDLLKKLLTAIPGIKTAAIVSAEGLPIFSILPRDIDETKIAAVTAALCSLSKKAITEIQRGGFEELYIGGRHGYLLVRQIAPDAVLIVSADKNIRLDRFPGTPFPYIFKPPYPPEDLDGVDQVQVLRMSPPEEIGMGSFCKYCGVPLDEGVSVCPNCKKKNP